MTILEEHEAKLAFIAAMGNPYDYLAFKNYCVDNGFEVMGFAQYALHIEPPQPRLGPANPSEAKDCGGCGGGTVR